jgi:hypothetical protein
MAQVVEYLLGIPEVLNFSIKKQTEKSSIAFSRKKRKKKESQRGSPWQNNKS